MPPTRKGKRFIDCRSKVTWHVIISSATDPTHVETLSLRRKGILRTYVDQLACQVKSHPFAVDICYPRDDSHISTMLFPGMRITVEGREIQVVRV